MRSRNLGLAFVAMIAATVTTQLSATEPNTTPIAYFLEQAPPGIVAPNRLPRDAKDVVVAKIRLQQPIFWLGGRHCEGCTNDIFGTSLRIIEVVSGKAEVGETFDVRLGQRSEHRASIAFPVTPDQRGHEYTVLIYLAEDGLRRLVAFPISQFEYDKWDAEVGSYERLRGKPGYHE